MDDLERTVALNVIAQAGNTEHVPKQILDLLAKDFPTDRDAVEFVSGLKVHADTLAGSDVAEISDEMIEADLTHYVRGCFNAAAVGGENPDPLFVNSVQAVRMMAENIRANQPQTAPAGTDALYVDMVPAYAATFAAAP